MSLDWDITDCKDSEGIMLNQEVEGDITEQIIWSSLVIKLGDITEKNWYEWYARYTIWNRIMCFDNDLEAKDFHRRIGMSTNVFPAESRSKWLNSTIKKQLEKAESTAQYQIKLLLEEETVDA